MHVARPGEEPSRLLPIPLAGLVASIVFAAEAASPAPLQAQELPGPEFIDGVFAEFDRDGHPGCAVGIYRDGDLAFSRGYGEANLDWAIPIDEATVFYSGSVSKQFTAALAALLHLDGTLDLETDVRAVIPELPPYDPPVTIRQLVQHTSGVRDIYGLIGLSGARVADAWTDGEYLELIARQTTLNHEPGSDYLYSNGGYYLLTTALERAGDMSLDELGREYLFEPLGMDDTHFHQDRERIVSRRAMSYGGSAENGFRQTYLGNFDKAGAGGLYTTIRDMAAWDRNLATGEVGGRDFLALMTTPGKLTNGDRLSYGFGLTLAEVEGRPTVGHGGSFMGFRADYLRFPEDGFAVAALCNLGSVNPGEYTREIAREILAPGSVADDGERGRSGSATGSTESDERTSERDPPSVSKAAFAGHYWSPEVENGLTVSWTGEELRARRHDLHDSAPLDWRGGDAFRGPGWTVEFEVGEGNVIGLVLDAGRVRNLRFERQGGS